jgi:hypothetical protein
MKSYSRSEKTRRATPNLVDARSEMVRDAERRTCDTIALRSEPFGSRNRKPVMVVIYGDCMIVSEDRTKRKRCNRHCTKRYRPLDFGERSKTNQRRFDEVSMVQASPRWKWEIWAGFTLNI